MALVEHLEKLRHFHKISQFRSINETAAATGLSQAGLSKSLAALEGILGVTLFVRSNSGLTLTKEGDLALRAAKSIISEAEGLESRLSAFKATVIPTTLRVGMYDSIAVYFFEELSSYLNIIYQGLKIELIVDTSGALASLLKRGDVELIIGVNLEGKKRQGDEFFFLFEDSYSFYLSTKIENDLSLPLILHPLASDLAGVTMIDLVSALIERRGAHRVYNFETIKTLTVQGLGVGVLPTRVARPLVQQRQLKPVQISRAKSLFGKHNIGFLASEVFLRSHREFANDLYRLGEHWVGI